MSLAGIRLPAQERRNRTLVATGSSELFAGFLALFNTNLKKIVYVLGGVRRGKYGDHFRKKTNHRDLEPTRTQANE